MATVQIPTCVPPSDRCAGEFIDSGEYARYGQPVAIGHFRIHALGCAIRTPVHVSHSASAAVVRGVLRSRDWANAARELALSVRHVARRRGSLATCGAGVVLCLDGVVALSSVMLDGLMGAMCVAAPDDISVFAAYVRDAPDDQVGNRRFFSLPSQMQSYVMPLIGRVPDYRVLYKRWRCPPPDRASPADIQRRMEMDAARMSMAGVALLTRVDGDAGVRADDAWAALRVAVGKRVHTVAVAGVCVS